MEYHSGARYVEGFFLVLPLIIIVICWSEHVAPLIKLEDYKLTKKDIFIRDLFLISFSFILAGLF
jgi:hypothetical protein